MPWIPLSAEWIQRKAYLTQWQNAESDGRSDTTTYYDQLGAGQGIPASLSIVEIQVLRRL